MNYLLYIFIGITIFNLLMVFCLRYITSRNAAKLQITRNDIEQKASKNKQLTEKAMSRLKEERHAIDKERRDFLALKRSMTKGFPLIAEAEEELLKLRADLWSFYLKNKPNPAKKASELVQQEIKLRSEAQKRQKQTEYLLKYYETIAPFLAELHEEETDDEVFEEDVWHDYTEDEKQDHATKYLTKEEYRKLTSAERNQLALDRYWKRPKSKRHIGTIYERYVGHLFEEEGYDVEYVGIFKGYEDLGRDLIATKGTSTKIVQCKYWSQFRTIYEKHIFQFFGTVFQFKDSNPGTQVTGIFYTTTTVSELARKFSKELGLELVEDHKMDYSYPCIKCNVSRKDNTKIYHLPFDQQYDKVKIEKDRNEFYCHTVKEAEERGFRRAYRYTGFSTD